MLDPDVREILDDPEVGGGVSFTVKRVKHIREKVSVKKEVETFEATGNIQPANKSATPGVNEDALDEQIVIRTTFILQSGRREAGEEYGADEVIFKGNRWRVLRVNNWEDWGFVEAYATRTRE